MKTQEVELKLRISDVDKLIQQILKAGGKDLGEVDQIDILYDYPKMRFDKLDQALRLRIQKIDSKKKAVLTFKGTPSFSKSGIKTRDEFETEIDGDSIEKILVSIGLEEKVRIEKKRKRFELKGVEIAIDSLKFGDFVELEGNKKKIEETIKLLGLVDYEVVTKSYIALLFEWQRKKKDR